MSRQYPTELYRPIGPEDHTHGDPNAPVQLVEYGDFECPHCRAAYSELSDVFAYGGDRIFFAFRHFPLSSIHPHAEHAAEISEVAADAGKFWEMHNTLFEHQDALDDISLFDYAAGLGLDQEEAALALTEGRYRPRIMRDVVTGWRSGVEGTPTFFINNKKYVGSYKAEELIAALVPYIHAYDHSR
jgi:protein-disulfide isomerase